MLDYLQAGVALLVLVFVSIGVGIRVESSSLDKTTEHEEILLFHKIRNRFVNSYCHGEGVPEMTDNSQLENV